MTRGRNICNILKAIRKQIADANEIKYSPEECHFKGECKGTCPKCEQDVKDLEYELRLRQMAGKAIKVAGIALGITTLATSTTSCATQKAKYDMESSMPEKVIPISYQDYTSNDTILLKEKEELGKKGVLFVQGHVIDDEKNPIFGAIITSKLSGKQTLSDIDGNFTLEVKQGDMITVKYIGFQDRVIKLSEMSQDKLNIVTLTAHILGEVIAGIVPYPPKTTPVIKRTRQRQVIKTKQDSHSSTCHKNRLHRKQKHFWCSRRDGFISWWFSCIDAIHRPKSPLSKYTRRLQYTRKSHCWLHYQ